MEGVKLKVLLLAIHNIKRGALSEGQVLDIHKEFRCFHQHRCAFLKKEKQNSNLEE